MSQDEQIALLKQELKTWERAFSAANGGAKPSREDIKKEPAIAAKYKEYDQLRRPQSKKSTSQSKPASKPAAPSIPEGEKAAKSASKSQPVAATPQKRKSHFAVPALPTAQSLADEGEEEEEDDEIEPTPAAIRMQLGPTPLKDGQILSLFDCLSSGTPSKPRTALQPIEGNIAATPSKKQQTIAESPAVDKVRGSRTPASSGKRYMLDTFNTPLKRKRDDDNNVHGTPSSSMKLLATPAFLQRSNTLSIMETLAEEGEQDRETIGLTSTRGPPFKKKRGFIRSLSSIIQGMRKQEDDQLDEELEIMREMEGFDDMDSHSMPKSQAKKRPEPEVLVQDSQVVMPLGPDRTFDSDYDESDEEDENGQPRKVWKKKGLKRQTKRVMMRPVIHKPKKPDVPTQLLPETDDDHTEVVAETQLQDPIDVPSDFFDESDFSDSEAKLQRAKTAARAAVNTFNEPEGPMKKAARMISAGAHANFRRLNIRNQNSKAKGKGRFGRK